MNPPKKFKSEPFGYHEEIELRIDTLTNLGLGLGRVGEWVVMVAFVLPGELVKARVFRNYKNYSEADLVKVLEASDKRIEPVCPLFGVCGGCQYQNLAYKEQLLWKRKQVEEVLERLAGISVEVNETWGSPEEYHYRSKLTPHFPKPKEGEDFPIGFLRQGQRRRLVDVPACPIATKAINEALPGVREDVRRSREDLKRGGTVLLREVLEGVVVDPKAVVSERVGDLTFQFRAGEFFQNNPYILPQMVEYVLGEAKGEGVRYLIDAYCGVGVFALSGSARFEKCVGVEVNPSAVAWANRNAEINGIKNCEFIEGTAEAILGDVGFDAEETAVVVDPPRKGCDVEFIDQLMIYGPRRVVYVSCDPATQARDLRMLMAGGYVVKGAQPFDLFPQTRHIENIVTLTKE